MGFDDCNPNLSRIPLAGMFGKPSLAALLIRYRDSVTPRKRGRASERARINAMLRHPLARLPAARIRAPDIAAYRDARLQTVSGATVRRELVLLAHVFETARHDWGMAVPNPVRDIRKPPDSVPRDRRLDPDCEEERRLLDVCRRARNPYLLPIVQLALETAMRRGELLSLDWRHIRLERRTAYLPLTKSGRPRWIPLSSAAVAVLQTLGPRSDGLVFSGLTVEAIKQSFRRAVRRAGLPDFRFHDLRHEATSRLFEQGLNTAEVATITGHRDPRMLQRYTHLRAEDLAQKLK